MYIHLQTMSCIRNFGAQRCDIGLYVCACMMMCSLWSSIEFVERAYRHTDISDTSHLRDWAQDAASGTLRDPCECVVPLMIVVLAWS